MLYIYDISRLRVKVLFSPMPGGTEKSHQNPQPRQAVTVLRHEPPTSRIRSKEVHHSTAKFAEFNSNYKLTFIRFSD